ncbi:MAG TPA: hypothetical protein VGJ86_11700 [Acidimicrobiales bacterium]|jgi:hypothetical protein
MSSIDFMVTGDVARAKATAVNALEGKGFRLAWSDEWTATAEKGNKVANLVVGGFAQYIKMGLEVRSTPVGDQSLIRLIRSTKGYMGGAIGVMKTNKNSARLRDELAAVFQQAGVLVNVSEMP